MRTTRPVFSPPLDTLCWSAEEGGILADGRKSAIFILRAERVHPLNVPFTAVKTVTRWGSGSKELVKAMQGTPSTGTSEPHYSNPLRCRRCSATTKKNSEAYSRDPRIETACE